MALSEESHPQTDPMGDDAEARDVETVETSKDPLLGNREGPGLLSVEDLSMRHYWRLSTIMGMADILLDVDKYFTYMLLINRCVSGTAFFLKGHCLPLLESSNLLNGDK
jgi:hypothetical protein